SCIFFFSSRRRHTRSKRDWSSDVCSSDLSDVVIGDEHGNIVHLYERDCSVQRRHQKVVEVAPSVALTDDLRERICDAAIQLMERSEERRVGKECRARWWRERQKRKSMKCM